MEFVRNVSNASNKPCISVLFVGNKSQTIAKEKCSHVISTALRIRSDFRYNLQARDGLSVK